MASKLFEMDEVVKTIHINTLQNLEDDQGKTLLVCDNSFFAWIVYYRIDDLFIVVWIFQDININGVWGGGKLMGGISIAAVLILQQTNHKRTSTVTD